MIYHVNGAFGGHKIVTELGGIHFILYSFEGLTTSGDREVGVRFVLSQIGLHIKLHDTHSGLIYQLVIITWKYLY